MYQRDDERAWGLYKLYLGPNDLIVPNERSGSYVLVGRKWDQFLQNRLALRYHRIRDTK